MFSKNRDIVSVILSEHSFKIAHLKVSPSSQSLVNVFKKDIREMSEEESTAALQSAVREMNVKQAEAVCAVPANLVITKNIEIPSLDPAEIKSIIDLQAGRHTPYSREEILVGCITIGVFQRNYTKVLLIIINRETIKKQMAVFEQAGLKVGKILFAPECISRFYARALHIKEEDVPVGIIDICQHTTEFIVEFNKTAATCRNIPLGMNQLIKEGDPAKEKLVSELLSSLEAYQSEDVNRLPESYYLTSDDPKIKELQPLLQEKLKANVKVLPYLDHIQADQQIMLKLVSEYNDDSLLGVVSSGATCHENQVDLIPDEVKTQRAIEEKGREIVKSGILGVIIFVLVWVIFFSKFYFKNIYLRNLTEEYQKKRQAVTVLESIAEKTRIIKDYLNSRMTALDVLNELYNLLPDEIYLQAVTLDEKGTVDIQGISESMSRVFNFVTALEESQLFKNVKTKSTTAQKDRGKDVAAFEIEFKLESAKDEAEAETPAEVPAEVGETPPAEEK